MSDDITIKNISWEDVFPLIRICNQTFLEGARYPECGINAVAGLERHPDWQWGAYVDGVLAGFILGQPRPADGKVHLRLIGVDPSFKGKGIGSRLIAVLEARARADKYERIDLGTPYARSFYEKNGFSLARLNVKMVRDITQQAAPLPEGAALEEIGFDRADTIALQIDAQARGPFLKAFLGTYRKSAAMAVGIHMDDAMCGVVVAHVSEHYADLAEVLFYAVMDADRRADVVRSFEYRVSTLGLKQIGFTLNDASEEGTFEALGYRRSELDYFWTNYTMEKKLT